MKLKIKIQLLFIIFPIICFSQEFKYRANIEGVENEWHQIILNKEILSIVNKDFSDIRIYEVNTEKDTLEVPYFIESIEKSIESIGVNFKILNQSKKDDAFYITLKVEDKLEINEIDLRFSEVNYDYKLELEASQDQKEWFQLVENYRILSIKNHLTDYRFNKIQFSNSSYQFYRIKIKNAEKVNLKSASVYKLQEQAGKYNTYQNTWTQEHYKDSKNTELEIDLKARLPISNINLELNNSIDYYRQILIKYLVDSVKTDKGWYYNYSTISKSNISSLEKAAYQFETVFTNKLKIEIVNQDNQSLKIDQVEVLGPEYKLTARFNSNVSEYYMLFGNKRLNKANYDIINFKKNIPENLTTINLENIVDIAEEKASNNFLNNKLYLWIILAVIILLLGYSSLSMLKKK